MLRWPASRWGSCVMRPGGLVLVRLEVRAGGVPPPGPSGRGRLVRYAGHSSRIRHELRGVVVTHVGSRAASAFAGRSARIRLLDAVAATRTRRSESDLTSRGAATSAAM